MNDLWTDENGVRYRLVRPEIVSYAQKPVDQRAIGGTAECGIYDCDSGED